MPPDCYEQNSFKNLYINFKEEEIPVKEKNSEVCYIQIWSLEEGTFRIFLFVCCNFLETFSICIEKCTYSNIQLIKN